MELRNLLIQISHFADGQQQTVICSGFHNSTYDARNAINESITALPQLSTSVSLPTKNITLG